MWCPSGGLADTREAGNTVAESLELCSIGRVHEEFMKSEVELVTLAAVQLLPSRQNKQNKQKLGN